MSEALNAEGERRPRRRGRRARSLPRDRPYTRNDPPRRRRLARRARHLRRGDVLSVRITRTTPWSLQGKARIATPA